MLGRTCRPANASRNRRLCLVAVPLVMVLLSACGAGSSTKAAATVNGHDVSMSAYNTDLRFRLDQVQQSDGIAPCASKDVAYLCAQVKQTALTDVIEAEVVRQYAADHNITVPEADVNREWTVIFRSKFQGSEKQLDAYAARVGVKPGAVKERTRTDLLNQRVMLHVVPAVPSTAPAVVLSRLSVATSRQISNVQARLKQGVPFNTLVSEQVHKKTSVCAQQGCGVVGGWLPEKFVPPQESGVNTAPVGSIVGPIASQGGFTLIRVVARNPHYSLTTAQQATWREQVFAEWLSRQVKRAAIQRHVAV